MKLYKNYLDDCLIPFCSQGSISDTKVSITFVNIMCNVNVQLEIKGTISDFLKHLKESICKLGLDVILTDFFFLISLTLSAWPWLQRDCAARVQQEGAGEVKFMLTLDTLKKPLNLTVSMLFLEILYHICINSMKSCIIIYQKSVVLQGFWEFIESRRKIRVWVFLACLACLTV